MKGQFVDDTGTNPRPPSRKRAFSELLKRSSKVETSLTPDIKNQVDDTRRIARPATRKHGFSEVLRNSLQAPPSLVTDIKDKIGKIPQKYSMGFSEVCRNSLAKESIETPRSLVPPGTCQKIKVRHAMPKREVCRTGDPEGRPWKPGRIPHFDLRTACSRETFERIMFIREDFQLTPSQTKITDMGEFIAAKKEYLRIKRGGKVRPVETLHVSKLEAKESHEDPNLFGDDAWPLPPGKHVPPVVSPSLVGTMSRYSFEQRLVPVLERDFGVTILEPDPLPSKWMNFKSIFKMGKNRSSAEPKKPPAIHSEPSSSWFGTMQRKISKKWTKLRGKKKEREEVEERLARTELIHTVPHSKIAVDSEKVNTSRVREPKAKGTRHQVKTSAKENPQRVKPEDDTGNLRDIHHPKNLKTSGTKFEKPTDEPEQNSNLRPRRHQTTLSHRQPD